MDDVASSSGYEPSEEDTERQNLQDFDYDPSDYDAGHSSFDRLPTARFNTEDLNFDRYVQKRTHELRNFHDPQETFDAPQKPNTTEKDEIAPCLPGTDSVLDGSVERQSSEESNSPGEQACAATKEYRVGDKLLIADAGGGTVNVVTYKINELEPLEIENAASEISESTTSGVHKDDEDLGQSEPSKGKGPARPDEPTSTESPKRQPTDPSTSYQPCDTLSVGNLPLDVLEEELKELFSEQRGYRRMLFRTKASGPMCYVQFDDTFCAMKALFLLQGKPLRNSVNGGMRLGFSRYPLGVRSEPPVAAINSQIEVETLHEEAGDDAKRGREQDTEKQHFERSLAGRALRDFATKEDYESSIRQVWKAR
ncbi:hypothetical protein IFR04_001816 [Cadophora malorum]|uniref:RRM domain-containing protein n=1 Tax=Cadophora malorum TaxID=108018 RepID=A0A8H8BV17_9HELO|nr:hypothetical protein IFR04_001816 [Cadophora malorum]